MEKLISCRSSSQFVPESYILPPDSRPRKTEVPLFATIPVIDVGGECSCDQRNRVKQIMQASREFGFCQVLDVANEFFELPDKDKVSIYSEDPTKRCRLLTSIDYGREKTHYWRDTLRHSCHPLQEHIQFWPEKPPHYREVVGSYSKEVMELISWLLDLICEGLGLASGYFRDELSPFQVMMSINHYPPCPDPSLTLGLPKHSDPNLITLLLQGKVNGLQVLKNGQWLAVEPLPNAFVVNIGHALQIMSNGELHSAEHRVVTHKNTARTTIATFVCPSSDCKIGPLKALLSDCNNPLYREFTYKDFISTYTTDTHARVLPLDRYKIEY